MAQARSGFSRRALLGGGAVVAVVGGAGYIWGGVLGAVIVIVLKEILQSYLPLIFGGQGQLELIVFGLVLVALVHLAPGGVWPWLAGLLPFKRRAPRIDTSLHLAARPATELPPVLLTGTT